MMSKKIKIDNANTSWPLPATNLYNFVAKINFEFLRKSSCKWYLENNKFLICNQDEYHSNKTRSSSNLGGFFTNLDGSRLQDNFIVSRNIFEMQNNSFYSRRVLFTFYADGHFEICPTNNEPLYIEQGSFFELNFIQNYILDADYNSIALVRVTLEDYKNDVFPRRDDTEKRWDLFAKWFNGQRLIRWPWQFDYIFNHTEYERPDETFSNLISTIYPPSRLQDFIRYDLSKYNSFKNAKQDVIFQSNVEEYNISQDMLDILCKHHHKDKSFYYLFQSKQDAIKFITNCQNVQKNSPLQLFLSSYFYLIHNDNLFKSNFFMYMQNSQVMINQWFTFRQDERLYKYHVPIYFKPNGFKTQGLQSFDKALQEIEIRDLIKIDKITSYLPNECIEFHKALYPNCEDRPYGNDWFTYLSSGPTQVMWVHCQSLSICRNIVLNARKYSQILWTRNIAHCPENLSEYTDNKIWINKYLKSSVFYNILDE